MGQAQAAAPAPDLSKLKSLSARYNQFVPLHVVRKKSTCPAAASECDLYSTLYIQSDGSQCALGYVDQHNAFQPTTTAMSFAQVGEHGWHLVGTYLDDGEIVVLKCKNGDYVHETRQFATKLHIH